MIKPGHLVVLLAACSNAGSTPTPKAAVKLGDATVYELVDRKWHVRETPARELVLHADGTAEGLNTKNGKPWQTFSVKPDGSVTLVSWVNPVSDKVEPQGKPMGAISDRGVLGLKGEVVVPLDGDTLSVTIDGKVVKVVLGSDGKVTVVDRPDGVKWRIDASDRDVRRTAFLLLGMQMKTALD